VIGSMISLGYYLRVVATMWMTPAPASPVLAGGVQLAPIAGGAAPIAGGAPTDEEEDAGFPPETRDEVEVGPDSGGGGAEVAGITSDTAARHPEVVFVAVLFAAASVFFGIVPQPLFSLTAHAGAALSGLF
jgi:NADH-quinone oxidoreductase subunit N